MNRIMLTLIPLTPDAAAKLRRPVAGRGGMQWLLRRLQEWCLGSRWGWAGTEKPPSHCIDGHS